MTFEHVCITFHSGEGTLRRVLGLIEARGFNIRSMQMRSDADYATITVGLEPRDGTRRISVLLKQIQRLHKVTEADEIVHSLPLMEVHRAAVA